MFVYRDEYYLSKNQPEQKENETEEKYSQRLEFWDNKVKKADGLGEIIVAKQRHGPVGMREARFEKRLTKFMDLVAPDTLPESF